MASWQAVGDNDASVLNGGEIPGNPPRRKLQPGPLASEEEWGQSVAGATEPGNPPTLVRRRFRMQEQVFGALSYVGKPANGAVDVTQAWDRCDPNPDASPRFIAGGDRVQQSGVHTHPDNNVDAPSAKRRYMRVGKYYPGGYKVSGRLYKRKWRERQISRRPQGSSTEDWGPWEPNGAPDRVVWFVKRITTAEHKFPMLVWEPWKSIDCKLGIENASFGFFDESPEIFQLAVTLQASELKPGTYSVASVDAQRLNLEGLAASDHLVARLDSSKSEIKVTFFDQQSEKELLEIGQLAILPTEQAGSQES